MVRSLMMFPLLALLSFGGFVCGKSEERSVSTNARELRFKVARCIDREGIGIEAFSLLIPADWAFEAAIHWNVQNPGMPAVATMRTMSPDSTKEVDVFPNQSFFWTDNPMTRSMFPVGSRYFGAEVRPVLQVRDMLRRIVLPRFRRHAKELKVVKEENVPALARIAETGNSAAASGLFHAEGGKIRIEYRT
ncbi:MAG: hypothetical protein WB699_00550, partial [Bacteroidota bacterium]